MKKLIIAAASVFALAGAVACTESAADKDAEMKADAMEAEANATSNEATETQLNAQADKMEQEAGNADGGMTTSNTPGASPSAANQNMSTPPAQ